MSFFKKDRESNTSEVNQDIPSQLQKITEQLGFLEKKIDSLLEQSRGARPSFNRNRFGSGSGRPNSFNRPGGNGFRSAGGPGGGNGFRSSGGGNNFRSAGGPGGNHRPHRGGPRRHSADADAPQKFSNY